MAEPGKLTMSPKGTDFILATNIPDSETDVLVFHGLDIKPYD